MRLAVADESRSPDEGVKRPTRLAISPFGKASPDGGARESVASSNSGTQASRISVVCSESGRLRGRDSNPDYLIQSQASYH